MIKKTLLVFILSILSFTGFAQISPEQALISKARNQFENKNYEEALRLYNQVPTSSDRYLLVIEEKAWTYIHLNQYDKALAEARTLTSSALNGLTGTEPFLLKALVQLKICDYVGVFQTLKDFKSLKRNQIEQIQKIAKNKRHETSKQTLEKWMQNPADWKQLGPSLATMPQLFYKDATMQDAAKAKNMNLLEKRLQELAIIENNENYRILQKLNLIEIESIQRVHIASQFDGKQGEQLDKSKDDLVFKDSQEVWLDELNSYQATIHRCQKKSGRTM